MKDFRITEQEIQIDGKKELLLCGEIHYFRMEKECWGEALDRLVECGCNAVAYYVPWFVHEYEEGVFDFDGSVHLQNDLHSWIRLTMEKGLIGFLRPGPYVYAETTDLGLPRWFSEKYPNAQVKYRKDGAYEDFSTICCAGHNHPDFLAAVNRWYKAVAAQIKPYLSPAGNIVMVQLCNEIPCDDYDDRNPENLGIGNPDGLYPSYLAHKYGTREALEAAYGRSMPELSLVEPHMLEEADKEKAFRERQEFYYTWYYPEYFRRLRDMFLKEGIRTQFTHNAYNPRAVSLHYQNRRQNPWLFVGVDCYYSLTGNLDKKSGIYFAEYGADYIESFLKNPPWVAEHECGYWNDEPVVYGPELYIWNIWTIAGGYQGFNMYLFASGVNRPGMGFYGTDHNWQAPVDEKGRPRESFGYIAKSIQDIRKYQEILTAPKKYDLALGIKHDPGLIWTDCARVSNELYYALRRAGYSPKLVDFMEEDAETLKKRPVLAVVTDGFLEADAQRKLADYVLDGGLLILWGRVPWEAAEGPCTILADALGVKVQPAPLRDRNQEKIRYGGKEYFIGKEIQKILPGPGVKLLEENPKGTGAVWEAPAGKGRALLLPFAVEQVFDSFSEFVRGVLMEAGVAPEVSGASKLHVIPKATGEYVVLNIHPVQVTEELEAGGKKMTLCLAPYSFAIV